MSENSITNWEWKITSKTSWAGASVKEIFSYKDLLLRLVRKEFLTSYQQTLLGPVWMLINPLLTVLTYDLIFDKVIGVSTEGLPPFAYYLVGITLWNLFSDIMLGTSNTFSENSHIFSKVYYPRIISPLATTLLHFLRFFFQLLFLIAVVAYYAINGKIEFSFFNSLLSIPIIITTAGIGLGAGLILAVLTAMYRDLTNIIAVVMRLLMFICPIFYSQAIVPPKMRWLMQINPLSSLFELFRFSFLGKGYILPTHIGYTIIFSIFMVAVGVLLFNKTSDKLMDVI